MVLTVTSQSSENHISEGTKNVNPLLDRRPGLRQRSQPTGHNGGLTSVEGNSQGRAQLELHIRNNLSLEVENFRALLTVKSPVLHHCPETGGHDLVLHPLVDIMGTAPGPVNSNRLL